MSKLSYQKVVDVKEVYETVELELPWWGKSDFCGDTTYVHISKDKVVTKLKVSDDFGHVSYDLSISNEILLNADGWYYFFKNAEYISDEFTQIEMEKHLKNMKLLTGGLF